MMRETEVEESLVLGHVLSVFQLAESAWSVRVDGDELQDRCTSRYQAWAAGVAESYRRGQRPKPPRQPDLP